MDGCLPSLLGTKLQQLQETLASLYEESYGNPAMRINFSSSARNPSMAARHNTHSETQHTHLAAQNAGLPGPRGINILIFDYLFSYVGIAWFSTSSCIVGGPVARVLGSELEKPGIS